MKYLLDSVILIDHFNGITPATALLRLHRDELAISSITHAEVLTEFEQAELTRPACLLTTFGFSNIEEATADLAARLRVSSTGNCQMHSGLSWPSNIGCNW